VASGIVVLLFVFLLPKTSWLRVVVLACSQ